MLKMILPRSADTQLRSVSSVAFAIGGDDPYLNAIALVARWIRTLNPVVPESAALGESFDVGGGGAHPARAVSLEYEHGRVWSATIDDPDKTIIGRTWITEVTVAQKDEDVHIGIRLLNVTRYGEVDFVPSIPRFVRDIVNSLPCMADAVRLSSEFRPVESDDDLDWLVSLITSPHRTLPVIAMAQAVNNAPLVKLSSIARRLCGAAHVVGISDAQTKSLRRQLGRDLAVYDGALRMYRQGLKIDDADSFAHPLWLPKVGANDVWHGNPIIARVLSSGISKGTADYPRFDAVRQAVAEKVIAGLRGHSSDADLLRLFEEENAALTSQLESLRGEQNQWLSDAEQERASADARESELKSDLHRLRSQNEYLRNIINKSDEDKIPARAPLSDSMIFGEWAQLNIIPNIWIAPKAIKEMERSCLYKDISEIEAALLLLDDLYVPMRRSTSPEKHSLFMDCCEKNGFEVTDCFARSGDLRRFKEYSVIYRSEKLWCDLHLKRGGGTDPRSMFRIYFTWNPSDDVLVIGHLPTHLDNNMTN